MPTSGSNIRPRIRRSTELVFTSGFINERSLRIATVSVPPRRGASEAERENGLNPSSKTINEPTRESFGITI
jgi:hypothetical protein